MRLSEIIYLPMLGLFVWLNLALFVDFATGAQPPLLEPQPSETGQVEVTVTGFENDTGQALMSLFTEKTGWPDNPKAAFAAVALRIRDRMVVTRFDNVPVGPFAVAVFHDQDRDEELDRNVLGIPREDYGFSRDARGRFGPPSFDDARLEMATGQSMQIRIQVR